ncbi:UDP-N-acetylmuramoyl-tripeptide--D-alanyl-D-alanine ligase [uncultured Eubacterium sp.]|nr:UDP-N-acetylmuramoyl-tripeptide--D-alanyl-D-alanine ligase [uncultured Eubacterium sp.]
MNEITIAEIEKATCGTLIAGCRDHRINNVCTDSRKAREGDLFVPIVGEVHDAHKFIPQVIEKGCGALLTAEESAASWEGCDVVLVEDTTKAIQALASYYLEKLKLKKIAVTGSVGKTSTRDMVYYVLSEKYRTGKTAGNFNNDIGVPLTIFSFDDSMEAAVLEVGMDHAGEIHRLVDIIRPDIGIITNVGISHIENLGSREGILQAKLEIADYFDAGNTLVINQSNDMLGSAALPDTYTVLRVGLEEEAQFYVHDVEDYGEAGICYDLTADGKDYKIKLGIPGAHNAVNSALALAAAVKVGVTIEEGIAGLAKIQLTDNRLTIREIRGIKIIDDTYNAAPDSMKSAINTLVNTSGTRKIAILGGMNELGPDSPIYHQEVGRYAGEKKIDLLITVGEKARDIAKGGMETLERKKVMHFDTKEQLYEQLDNMFAEGDIIIVKASRSMEMEQVVERIMEK